jgi:CheY-specific phosphatase CheX
MRKMPTTSEHSDGRRSGRRRAGVPSGGELMSRTMFSILHQTSAVLAGEGMARIDGFDVHELGQEFVKLHDITAVAGFGLPVGLLIAFSFDQTLLGDILDKATGTLPVPDDERELYLRETAAEVVNTVLGLCTADFDLKDTAVSLSPPVVMEGARDIQRRGDAVFASMEILTDKGAVSVNLFGPRHLFDDSLNYRH